ncbi:spore germination protein [Bacillus cereus]|uniref:spore germination protein n=1 Tax=Bacillus cereus TaxID=1396 RepID=UPI000952D242|nr:spore germination protein [Bacillus cereus]
MQHPPTLSYSLSLNLKNLQYRLSPNFDIIYREFDIPDFSRHAVLIYLKTITDVQMLQDYILRPLLQRSIKPKSKNANITVSTVTNRIELCDIQIFSELDTIVSHLFAGSCILLLESMNIAFILNTSKTMNRAISEPTTESSIHGSKESFVEILSINVSMLRRNFKSSHLSIQKSSIGVQTQRDVAVIYLDHLTNKKFVTAITERICAIDIDDILDNSCLEQLLSNNPYSPFPQMIQTERPDRVIQGLLKGQVAVILDGSPFVLLTPITLALLLHTPEDDTERWWIGTTFRLLRLFCFLLALLLPALYITFISFHPGLIPWQLIIFIQSSRGGVPFSTFIETFIMACTIECLGEAGIRLPRSSGQAVGIVGGLVIGQSAVEAGLVSPVTVVIVALTTLCSFAIPQYGLGLSIRLLRFLFIISAAIFGLYGIIFAFLFLCAHLVKLQNFGVNYLGYFVHYQSQDWKDTFIRLPIQWNIFRNAIFKTQNRKRINLKKRKKGVQ